MKLRRVFPPLVPEFTNIMDVDPKRENNASHEHKQTADNYVAVRPPGPCSLTSCYADESKEGAQSRRVSMVDPG